MRAAKVSVTVDGATLDEVKRLAGKGVNLSAIFSEALRKHMYRLRLLALLDEMDRADPMTPEGLAAGEKLWQAMQSSSTPAPSRRLPNRKSRSASQSVKR
ncbi:MAG: hypothetical protein QOF71_2543 [Candidatus Eremiobacteraeota bacterium]|jgi:hypothetical protein|nr:hypothetical protein [Candidatus Eremiobacteraeota bacterium]